jgi:L-lactate dehydrogenase (cytochrome)
MARKPVNVEQYRRVARRRLPSMVFDFLDGGALDESTLRANTDDLFRILLQQRILRDVADVDVSVTVLGRPLGRPILIAPMGLLSLFRPEADVAMARAAHDAGTIFVHSAWSGAALADVAAAGRGSVWAQAAFWRHSERLDEHLERIAREGIDVLVLPGDVAYSSKRERDLRHGFSMTTVPRLASVLDAATHPRWCRRMLTGPPVSFGNQTGRGRWRGFKQMAEFLEDAENPRANWEDLRRIRQRWSGRIVLKGVMAADDARRAVDAGVDAVYVSNHGGRQFDSQPSTAAALPAIARAVGGQTEILVDGGVRRGSDVVKMRAMGATACLVGRPAVYGLAAQGPAGVGAVLDILTDELRTTLGFVGARSFADVSDQVLAASTVD